MKIKINPRILFVCFWGLILNSRSLKPIQTYQLPKFDSLNKIEYGTFFDNFFNNRQSFFKRQLLNGLKDTNDFSVNQRLVIEKKIKENLMDRLKTLHASSRALR